MRTVVGGDLSRDLDISANAASQGHFRAQGIKMRDAGGGWTMKQCEEFEQFPLGSQIVVYHLNPVPTNTWQSFDADFWGAAFQWGNGNWTDQGFARIVKDGNAGGSGKEVWVNNINLCFGTSFERGLEFVRFRFGEYGGNLNLMFNGHILNFENFEEIHKQVIGDVRINVLSGGAGNDKGEIEFQGPIRPRWRWGHFAVGGQELWIDDFCWG
jgi:hypothetical protein